MKFQRRFGNRKKSNPKRGLFLIGLLIVVLYLFFKADTVLEMMIPNK